MEPSSDFTSRGEFVFTDQIGGGFSEGDISAWIPAELSTKEELFRLLSFELDLPDYFGGNWDALHECLNDFHWLKASRVIMRHAGLPSIPRTDLKTYLEILSIAVAGWAGRRTRELIVTFPTRCRDDIESMLSRARE
jgi:barstar (barnase inhibitor)